MVITACQCDEAYGLPHTHTPKRYVFRSPQGREFSIDEDTARLNRMWENHGFELIATREEGLSVWIDWKAVAKDLMTTGGTE